MKAVIWTKYGPPDVLQLREIDKPAPKENEVLVKVLAATVNAGDCEMRSLKIAPYLALLMRLYLGIRKPTRKTVLGQEFAGVIEAVGSEVRRFQVGDEVFGLTSFVSSGAYAEYICLPEAPGDTGGVFVHKPANLALEICAALPLGGLEAVHFLRKANIQAGQKVLINGAGGSIGTLAVQLARHYGAEVTAVDSAEKLDMLRSIGAARVIDYAREDFTRSAQAGAQAYDVILDVVGKSPFSASLRALKENGHYLIANPRPLSMLRGALASGRSGKRVAFDTSTPNIKDLLFLKELAEAGEMVPVIDRRYPLEQTAEAHRYVETGRKQGSVIITI